MSYISIPKIAEKLPKDRRCKKPGCDGEYKLIFNSVSCYKCGWNPWTKEPKHKRTARADNKAIAALDQHIDTMLALDWILPTDVVKPKAKPGPKPKPKPEHKPKRVPKPKPERKPRGPITYRKFDSRGILLEKLCTTCGEIKEAAAFTVRTEKSDGRHYRCKPCHNSIRAAKNKPD